jgi:hypothetical protein
MHRFDTCVSKWCIDFSLDWRNVHHNDTFCEIVRKIKHENG